MFWDMVITFDLEVRFVLDSNGSATERSLGYAGLEDEKLTGKISFHIRKLLRLSLDVA